MTKKQLVLDYDGTLTNVATHFPTLRGRFEELFSERAKIPLKDLAALSRETYSFVLADPKAGWVVNDVVVCNALSDPYVTQVTVYQAICEELGIRGAKRDQLLTSCFKDAYAQTPTKFREGITEFVERVSQVYEPVVVTNSSTHHVRSVLDKNGLNGLPVSGDAMKFLVDREWKGAPTSVNLPGFPRPVMLGRRNYAEALERLGATQETTVMGDIYEMDLALPDHLGMRIIQIAGAESPRHEIEYVRAHSRGAVVCGLEEAADVLLRQNP